MHSLLRSPTVPPCPSTRECGVAEPASHHLTASPLYPAARPPRFLPVWVSVSSLSPWLSDFHTVRFSVSSGCFLFLNCCCSSFGCERRRSVSTYTSILARSHSLSSNFHRFCFFFLSFHLTCLKAMHPFSLVAVKIFSLSFIFYNLFSSFSVTYYLVICFSKILFIYF